MSHITERLRETIAGLEADLREERERIASMRIEWAAEVAELHAKIDALRTDGVRVLIAASQPAWDA